MEPVTITESKNWSSIDIFLFSNGQQYSPPRKYHLRAEELQLWGITLNYLGRTHYGSGHSSIELYTLDGININGPLQLINGAAYVAVEPPDSFIDTGYEEYLLRATRSWEKRLSQKTYNTNIQNPDVTCDNNAAPKNADDNNSCDLPENIAETASFKTNNNILPLKNNPTKPQQRLQRKSITSSKQIQKKKSFDAHTNILKKICAETDKVFLCPKRNLQNKNDSMNTKTLAAVSRKVIESHGPCCKKRSSLKPENIEDSRKNSIKSEKLLPMKTSIDRLNLNAAVDEEKPVIELYNNNDNLKPSKHDSYLYPKIEETEYEKNVTEDPLRNDCTQNNDTDNNQSSTKKSTNESKVVNGFEQSDIQLKNDVLKNQIRQDFLENTPTTINYEDSRSINDEAVLNHLPVSEKQVTDEYVAQMNKGGILLLKLKIKLKDCKTIFNVHKNKDKTPIIPSLSDLPTTEKTSQVDININFSGELLKSDDGKCTQNESLQSLLNKIYAGDTGSLKSKNTKIIVLQCACRNYSNNVKSCLCENPLRECQVKDGKCEGTFHTQNLNETFTSCHNEPLETSKDETFSKETTPETNKYTKRSSKDESLPEDTIPESTKYTNNGRPSISKVNGSRVKHLAQKFELSDKTANENIKDNNNNNVTPINENHRQSIASTRLNNSPVLKDENEYKIKEYTTVSKIMLDKSTQTDWCNILLEARRNEDDNYTFHLPPLYILKQCKYET